MYKILQDATEDVDLLMYCFGKKNEATLMQWNQRQLLKNLLPVHTQDTRRFDIFCDSPAQKVSLKFKQVKTNWRLSRVKPILKVKKRRHRMRDRVEGNLDLFQNRWLPLGTINTEKITFIFSCFSSNNKKDWEKKKWKLVGRAQLVSNILWKKVSECNKYLRDSQRKIFSIKTMNRSLKTNEHTLS